MLSRKTPPPLAPQRACPPAPADPRRRSAPPLPACGALGGERAAVVDWDLLDRFVTLDFPRTTPQAVLAAVDPILQGTAQDPARGPLCLALSHLRRLGAALGAPLSERRALAMARESELLRAERLAAPLAPAAKVRPPPRQPSA
jgi:hypothetical protein